jgi:hypothetical protein
LQICLIIQMITSVLKTLLAAFVVELLALPAQRPALTPLVAIPAAVL